MNIFSLTDVAYVVAGGTLFEDVTVGIESGEKIGLVGRNGSGKSTFLRLLTGETEPDAGTVVRARDLHIATLAQNPQVVPGATIDDYVSADSDSHAGILRPYQAICDQLGLTDTTLALETLSGGMLKKAAIARCLAHASDFMILDEPTNHLDIDTVTWLEQRLSACAQGFVLVTHDRYILDAVCDTILEIDRGRVYRYPGNYSTYLERKQERQARLESAENRRVSILRTELEWLKRGARARTGKDKGRKERVAALLDGGLESEATVQKLPSAQRRLGKKALELHDIAKSYGAEPVISGFSYRFTPGEKVGIIGPNGSGKSTFLDVIAGRTEPDRGTVERGETTAFVYFDQTGSRVDTQMTVLEYMKDEAERIRVNAETTLTAEQFLERFLFPRAMFSQPLAKLSGGEFRRLTLVRLLATAPNFLLLDEPTNDLDIDTLRVFEQYLEEFDGCALIVSHDRALLDRLTDSLFVFNGDGSIVSFVGNYEAYRSSRDRASTRRKAPSKKPQTAAAFERSDARSGDRSLRRGLSFREQREYEQLPDELELIENELKELESFFADAALDPDTLAGKTRRYHELRDTVEKKTKRWEELAERADG
ncbi:MAG: ABC transporter ATP-binding protein [Spirochaetaceae bacterium]|nr:MAG: ABC transporter ATP-binding protein [Spirochaetaceae bacterium]